MKKVIALGASNSSKSINQQFALWAANQLDQVEILALDLNDYEMPLFSIDRETNDGIPGPARAFKQTLKEADGIILSFAEHNGSYSAAFKNVMDWISRIEKGIWANKPMLLLATSPGPRGGQGVLKTASGSFPHQGSQVTGSFSLPSFGQNFDSAEGITDENLRSTFTEALNNFKMKVIENTVDTETS